MEGIDAEVVAAVRSAEERRFEFAGEQGWDASCGYSALATLAGRYRGRAVDEAGLLAQSGREGRSVVKVSLAELARLARALGLETRAWRCDYGALADLVGRSAPVLVHYDRPQGHFALVLRAGPDGVVAADPARGLELLTRDQFVGRWSGAVVEIFDPVQPDLGADLVKKAVNSTLGRARLIDRALASRP